MFTRVITIATNPATQCALYFTSKESAHVIPLHKENGDIVFNDDFGQVLTIKDSHIDLITTDMVTDQIQQFSIKAQNKLDELSAAEMFQEFLNAHPELKSKLEARANAGAPQKPLQPPKAFRTSRR